MKYAGSKIGWRLSEVSGLTWGQVDREQGIVRLVVGETKNDEGRTVYLNEELKVVFQTQWNLRKKGKKLLPHVFPNGHDTDKIKQFNKT
jgi:integrase